MDKIPRRFFKKKFKEWQENGYELRSFKKIEIDISLLPEYYRDQFDNTSRNIEKDYLLNHLIYNEIAYVHEFKGDLMIVPKATLIQISDVG